MTGRVARSPLPTRPRVSALPMSAIAPASLVSGTLKCTASSMRSRASSAFPFQPIDGDFRGARPRIAATCRPTAFRSAGSRRLPHASCAGGRDDTDDRRTGRPHRRCIDRRPADRNRRRQGPASDLPSVDRADRHAALYPWRRLGHRRPRHRRSHNPPALPGSLHGNRGQQLPSCPRASFSRGLRRQPRGRALGCSQSLGPRR